VALSLLGVWIQARLPGVPVIAVLIFLQFVFIWGYFAFFEGFREGQTPGKKRMGVRVILDTGHGITLREAALRNLVRLADFLPPPYLLGALVIAIHPRAKRLGDLVAGTVVVRDRPLEAAPPMETDPATNAVGTALLTDEELQLLREFLGRAPQLEANARQRLLTSLVARFADRMPARHQDDATFLATLLRDELAKRRGRVVVVPGSGGKARPRTNAAAAQRLAAHKGTRWREFEVLAERANRSGLDALGARELPDFAARYREVAADLARVRTYKADAYTRSRLERIVATGHNLLYRGERRSLRDGWRFVLASAPASVYDARRFVLVAFLSFTVPALAGYAAIRRDPALAEEALPATLLERADEGLERKREGRGYGEAAPGERATVASAIITNNIGVAFACFAGGIFLGVGSLVSLAFNGLLIGGASGHYQNVGLLDYLWTFVAGHGVLELFAIWCAGAAGLLIGSAFVRPGPYRRADAIVIRGRLAARLVGLCVVLLLVAGTIEGFFSTSLAPPPVKVAVSVTSAILLVVYLVLGTRRDLRQNAAAPHPGA
jgi:uncharacterized membrane protein SpoIIM required for sporulation/uncharacterized RDD family membrane protein YckC